MPRWGLLRTNTARALGGFGSLKRQATVILNRVAFRGLYQIAHSESPVEKWDNSTRWRDQTIETERIACRPKWLPPAVPAALNGTGPFSMSKWSILNRLTSTMRGRICCADRLRKLTVYAKRMRAKGFRWSTGESDIRSALGSSETNGPSPFILQASRARKESSLAPVSERTC
jgi:hypothetical protein